jgi:hypothetical protein
VQERRGRPHSFCVRRMHAPSHASVLVLFTLSTQAGGYFVKASKAKKFNRARKARKPKQKWKACCAKCKHLAFQRSDSQLCIVELRDPSASYEVVVPVRICGQPQVGQPREVSLLVVESLCWFLFSNSPAESILWPVSRNKRFWGRGPRTSNGQKCFKMDFSCCQPPVLIGVVRVFKITDQSRASNCTLIVWSRHRKGQMFV